MEHESNGNSAAAYECYQKAVDITPSIAHELIQVRKRIYFRGTKIITSLKSFGLLKIGNIFQRPEECPCSFLLTWLLLTGVKEGEHKLCCGSI